VSVLESRELAVLAATAAAEKKATDIVVLDVGETLVITNFFVVATGGTARQVSAIIDEVEATLKAAGARVLGREGEREGTWVTSTDWRSSGATPRGSRSPGADRRLVPRARSRLE